MRFAGTVMLNSLEGYTLGRYTLGVSESRPFSFDFRVKDFFCAAAEANLGVVTLIRRFLVIALFCRMDLA